jgi:hypothetical protein
MEALIAIIHKKTPQLGGLWELHLKALHKQPELSEKSKHGNR